MCTSPFRTRYTTTNGVPETTSSFVSVNRPGLPRFGWSCRSSTASLTLLAIRLAAEGLSWAIYSPAAFRSSSAGAAHSSLRILSPGIEDGDGLFMGF